MDRRRQRLASVAARGGNPRYADLGARELSVTVAAAESLEMLTGQDWKLDSIAWYDWYNGAALDGAVFSDQKAYVFPTYQRNITIFERLVFWSPKTFEQPAHPAGLSPSDMRTPYADTEDDQ